MFDLDNWQEIFSAIRKNKLRTFLTAFGVFWGIFMLVIMLGSGNGLRNGIMSDFDGMATNSFFIWAQRTNKAYKGFQPGRRFNYKNEDAIAIRNAVPEADAICPRNELGGFRGGNNVSRGVKAGTFNVTGDYPDYQRVEPMPKLKGRFINDLDISQRRKVAVIGSRVQEILFEAGEEPIGQYIKVNGVFFQVVGTFSSNKSGQQASQETQRIYLSFTTFQTAFNYGNIVGWFAITSKPGIPAEVTEAKVIEVLKQQHDISPDDQLAIGHWNMGKQFDRISGLFTGISILVWVVGIGTLLAGVIGVSNIMLIIVKERTKEIGIKRALGASPLSIVGQIILESVFLTSLPVISDYWQAWDYWEGISSLMASGGGGSGAFRNPEVDLQVALISLGVLVVAGALAGLIPARRAMSISPIEALRAD